MICSMVSTQRYDRLSGFLCFELAVLTLVYFEIPLTHDLQCRVIEAAGGMDGLCHVDRKLIVG